MGITFSIDYVPTTGTTEGMSKQDIINDFKTHMKENGIEIIDASFENYDYEWPSIKVTIEKDDKAVEKFFDFYNGKGNSIKTVKDLQKEI